MYTILLGQGKGGFTCVSIVIRARLHAVSRLFIIHDYMMQPVSLYMQSRTKDARQRVTTQTWYGVGETPFLFQVWHSDVTGQPTEGPMLLLQNALKVAFCFERQTDRQTETETDRERKAQRAMERERERERQRA